MSRLVSQTGLSDSVSAVPRITEARTTHSDIYARKHTLDVTARHYNNIPI